MFIGSYRVIERVEDIMHRKELCMLWNSMGKDKFILRIDDMHRTYDTEIFQID